MHVRSMSSCGVCFCVCLSVCLWCLCIVSKRINVSTTFFHHRVATPFSFFRTKRHGNIPTGTLTNGGVECRWGRPKSRFWAYIWLQCLLLTLKQTRCCQHGRRWTTATVLQINCDTSLAESGGVDCGRRRQNVYDKKPRRYAKDNRTAHLTARSDKSEAYVTNSKRLYSTFCTVEANYWQTWSIARLLCDSRATC